jgi:hypothetical protein
VRFEIVKKNAAPYAAAAVALFLIGTLSACSGTQQASPLGVLPQQSRARVPAASQTPIPFAYQTVDDPISSTNEVNAITTSGEIVGTVGSNNASSPYAGYSSTAPYSTFTPISLNGAVGTAITGISITASKTVIVGYVIVPQTLRGTWGYYVIDGIGGLTKDRKGLKGKTALTEILGVNDSQTAVGYYLNTYNVNTPFVLNIPALKYTNLKPPGGSSGAEATGINDVGDIVGWVGAPDGKNATGFYERLATYTSLAYPGAKATEALGINSLDPEQVVGFYVDSNGTKHGFVLTDPTGGASGQVWQTIDAPNAAGVTVVTGINSNDDICGHYIDSGGVQHGFVAVPSAS